MMQHPKTIRDLRPLADLKDPRSFDMAGRDATDDSSLVSGRVLADMAYKDKRIVLGSADLQFATQMAHFRLEHPERFLQFGISERTMLGAAAGLAASGYIPYVCTFACFAGLLGFENIRTDIAYPNLPVRILATHSGISMGFFSTSHHATEDLAAMRSVANMMIVSPCDGPSYEAFLKSTVDYPGPIYFRLGRGRDPVIYDDVDVVQQPGTPHCLHKGSNKLLIVTTGVLVGHALGAVKLLAQELGEDNTMVFNAHTLKPFDSESLCAAIGEKTKILVVEDHNVEGGLGTIIRDALADKGMHVPIYKHGLNDEFSIIGPLLHLYQYYGLDLQGIAIVARRIFVSKDNSIKPGSLWSKQDRNAIAEARGAEGTGTKIIPFSF